MVPIDGGFSAYREVWAYWIGENLYARRSSHFNHSASGRAGYSRSLGQGASRPVHRPARVGADPDHTRSLPLPELFRLVVELLGDARQVDFMVALGTHPALSEASLLRLVGITAEERAPRTGTSACSITPGTTRRC